MQINSSNSAALEELHANSAYVTIWRAAERLQLISLIQLIKFSLKDYHHRTLQGHTCVFSVCVSPDGRSIVSGSFDKTLKVWDVSSGACVRTLQGHTHVVTTVCMSPDGRSIVSGSADKTIKVWN